MTERAEPPADVRAGRAVPRVVAVDNLRAVLIAWIIAGHALLGYSALGGWAYADITEVTFTTEVELALGALLGSSALFVLGVFFLLAGLFTPGSLVTRGAARFVSARALRLGVPLAVMIAVVWPGSVWLAHRAAGRPGTYGEVVADHARRLDAGALWFVTVLLVFSLGYAGWWRLSGGRRRRRVLTGRRLVAVGFGITVTTFTVRLVFPMRGAEPVDLHLWQWPQLLAMFALGVSCAGTGLAELVPRRLYRGCGLTVLAVVLAMPLLAAVLSVGNLAADVGPFLGGWRWQALLVAAIEGVLTVAGSVFLLGVAQRRLSATGPVAAAAGRSSYAAFIAQGPVLLAVATATRSLQAPAEVKAVVVAVLGVLLSFTLGWLAVTRTPLGSFL